MKGAEVLHIADRMRLMFAADERACVPSVWGWRRIIDGGTALHTLKHPATGCARLMICAPWITAGGKRVVKDVFICELRTFIKLKLLSIYR